MLKRDPKEEKIESVRGRRIEQENQNKGQTSREWENRKRYDKWENIKNNQHSS